MNSDYYWEKEFYKNTYYLYDQGVHVGNLVQNSFCRKAVANFNIKRISFITSGLFRQKTNIYNPTGDILGTISYNFFSSSACINLNGKVFYLRNYDLKNTRWEMTDNNGTTIKFSGSTNKGIVETTKEEGELILSGLYVANQFWQSRIVLWIVILLPLWTGFLMLLR